MTFFSKVVSKFYGLFYFFGRRIPCYNCRKLCLQMNTIIVFGTSQITSDWFIFSEYFSDWWFNFIMVTWLFYFHSKIFSRVSTYGYIIFQSRISKWLLSNSKAVNTWENEKRRQIVPVLKKNLEKFHIKSRILVLSVLA